MASHFSTPLRYPGGKGKLTSYMERVLSINELVGGTYIEPYAGGAGMAINLLADKMVSRIVINDSDEHIYAFWQAVVEYADELAELISTAELTIKEWHRQREIFNDVHGDIVTRGFATLFMNRTNRSGILRGGPIGGLDQSGPYKLDARFNKADLVKRIEFLSDNADNIDITCIDGSYFLANCLSDYSEDKTLIYIDPPYYNKGSLLYMNHYHHDDHVELSEAIRSLRHEWILSYDDTPEIRKIYSWANPVEFSLPYSSYRTKLGNELFYCSSGLTLPNDVYRVKGTMLLDLRQKGERSNTISVDEMV